MSGFAIGDAARWVIRMEGVTKRRAQAGTAFELEVPSLCIRPGEFVAVVGESGCGKSTLLDMLALVLQPTRSVRFEFQVPGPDGAVPVQDIAALWAAGADAALSHIRREHLGYVLQTGGLLPFLSVRENLRLPLRLKGREAEDAGLLQQMARRMGVDSIMDKKPQYLSGGQRQRVAILRALCHRPAVVLADEPTAAVDKARAGQIVADFATLARERGCVVVMVTHDEALVDGVAERAYTFDVEALSASLTRSVCREVTL